MYQQFESQLDKSDNQRQTNLASYNFDLWGCILNALLLCLAYTIIGNSIKSGLALPVKFVMLAYGGKVSWF